MTARRAQLVVTSFAACSMLLCSGGCGRPDARRTVAAPETEDDRPIEEAPSGGIPECVVPSPAVRADEEPLVAVARRYYAVVEAGQGCRRPDPDPSSLAGYVTDRRGRPVAGASVTIERNHREGSNPTTRTDATGRFEVDLPHPGSGDLAVTVLAEGYGRFSVLGLIEPGELYVARLDRVVDGPFLERLTSETDPEERLWGLLELVGVRGIAEAPLDLVFSRLGALAPDLRRMLGSGAFERPDDRSFTPASRARRLLASWQADEDRQIVEDFLAAARFASRPDAPLTGATPDEVCARFTDAHFRREGVTTRTWNQCLVRALDEDAGRAMALFSVRYAHWGYEMRLFMRRAGGRWELTFSEESSHDHFD